MVSLPLGSTSLMEGGFVFPGAKKRAARRRSSTPRLLRDLLAEAGADILEALPVDGVGGWYWGISEIE